MPWSNGFVLSYTFLQRLFVCLAPTPQRRSMQNITSEKSPLAQPVSLFFPLLGTRFSRRKVRRLIGDQQARNTRTRQGTQRARNQR